MTNPTARRCGSAARSLGKRGAPRKTGAKRAGTVTDGDLPHRAAGRRSPAAGAVRDAAAPLGPSEVSGSAILAPPVPRGDAVPQSEKETAKAAGKPNARPMAAAKPIETPKPISAPPTPTRPTED